MKLRARDVMTREVYTVAPETPLLELERQLTSRRISGAPVIDEGKLVGVVSRTDVDRLIAEGEDASDDEESYFWALDLPARSSEAGEVDRSRIALDRLGERFVRDVMSSSVISVMSSDPVTGVARVMVDKQIHRVLVVDAGELVGLVSTLDLARALAEAG